MPVIEGRKLREPVMEVQWVGAKMTLLFHDRAHSLNWVRVEFTAEEFGDLFDRFADMLYDTNQQLALRALMEKR